VTVIVSPTVGSSSETLIPETVTAAGAAVATAAGSGLAAAAPGDTVEVNVGFSAESGRQEALAAADSIIRDFDTLDIVTIQAAKQAITGLSQRSDVRYVEENGTVRALGQTLPWGIDRTDSEVAHANGETGNGADIAIIDTGIDSDHPDLQANLGSGEAFVSCDTSGGCRFGVKPADNTCNKAWDDDNDHGTHVSGTANGVDNSKGVIGVSSDVSSGIHSPSHSSRAAASRSTTSVSRGASPSSPPPTAMMSRTPSAPSMYGTTSSTCSVMWASVSTTVPTTPSN